LVVGLMTLVESVEETKFEAEAVLAEFVVLPALSFCVVVFIAVVASMDDAADAIAVASEEGAELTAGFIT
jgi:hypothetical protein